jgi:hypothetical protein
VGEVLGQILPVTLVVWFSPVPVTAATLLLLSSHARSVASSYAAGWVLGITVYVVGYTLLGGAMAAAGPPSAPLLIGVFDAVVAVTMVVLAISSWRGRPRPGRSERQPGWMRGIDRMRPPAALGLGLVFSIFSPTHFTVLATVGAAIGGGGLGAAGEVLAGVLFVLIGTSSVTAPVAFALLAPERAAVPLRRLHEWVGVHGNTMATVMFIVFAADFGGKAIGAFL